MIEDETQNKADGFTRTTLIAFNFFGVCKIQNQTCSPIKTAFSDYPYSVLVFSLSAKIENLKGGKPKPRWWPFFFINAQQFYSSMLEPGKEMLFIHGRKKKSAGYLSSDIESDQASYVYTYTHESDPHQKAFDSEPEEANKCVI